MAAATIPLLVWEMVHGGCSPPPCTNYCLHFIINSKSYIEIHRTRIEATPYLGIPPPHQKLYQHTGGMRCVELEEPLDRIVPEC